MFKPTEKKKEKTLSKLNPSDKTFLIRACILYSIYCQDVGPACETRLARQPNWKSYRIWQGSELAQWLSAWLETEGPRVPASTASLLWSLSKNINPSLVLVQPRKTCHFITEKLLIRRKESNQTNKYRKWHRYSAPFCGISIELYSISSVQSVEYGQTYLKKLSLPFSAAISHVFPIPPMRMVP